MENSVDPDQIPCSVVSGSALFAQYCFGGLGINVLIIVKELFS